MINSKLMMNSKCIVFQVMSSERAHVDQECYTE
jgi:hypothetical protein